MRSRIVFGAICVALVSCGRHDSAARWTPTASAASVVPPRHRIAPALRDGDLIFHESRSRQSDMVRVLTRSRWTHMGVVFVAPSGSVVLEAVSPVRETRLDAWIARGREQRYVVKRLRDASSRLPPEVIAKMRAMGAGWLGRPYDVQFRWGDESLYCSELAYKLFDRAAGVRLGKIERAGDMNLNDDRVQRALKVRFADGRFDPGEPVVTPDSIFNDAQLVTIAEQGPQ